MAKLAKMRVNHSNAPKLSHKLATLKEGRPSKTKRGMRPTHVIVWAQTVAVPHVRHDLSGYFRERRERRTAPLVRKQNRRLMSLQELGRRVRRHVE